MSHRYHPTDDDPTDALLYDDCESCERMAGLTAVDPQRMAQLWGRMLDVEVHDGHGALTANEKKAVKALYRIGLFLEYQLGMDAFRPLSQLRAGQR